MLTSYNKLDKYEGWISDDEPCLFDISLPEASFLTPKIKWETGKIFPELSNVVVKEVKTLLSK